MHRLDHGGAHQPCRRDGAVETRQRHHFEDGAHAVALLANDLGDRAVELGLGGGIGAVAELVLQPHEMNAVRLAIGEQARHEETRQAVRRLAQHQKSVAHRRGHEPLVAGQVIDAPCPPVSRLSYWPAHRCRPVFPSSPCRRSARPSRLAHGGRSRICATRCAAPIHAPVPCEVFSAAIEALVIVIGQRWPVSSPAIM
jgi:hypothetical protein